MSTPDLPSPPPRYTVPADVDGARQRMADASIPAAIVGVARRLRDHGHAAVLVGGAVRDVLLGLAASDWDLATSATPSEVQALFRRTVPTGIEHGTITVLRRPPGADMPMIAVEVTTFRGESDYSDGRRPKRVAFLRDLTADLSRRDFTINALAWDPIDQVLSDPFDGLTDLRAGLVRAVGDPLTRLREDGLRTMRAVRLCATRVFALDPSTEAAIAPTLTVLDRVSRERVYVELIKLLGAATPSLGLRPMVRTGMWNHVLAPLSAAESADAIAAVDALPQDPILRLARLLWPLALRDPREFSVIDTRMSALRPSKRDRGRVVALTGAAAIALREAEDSLAIREAAAKLGRALVGDALALTGAPSERARVVLEAIEAVPLAVQELPITGGDLIAAGVVDPGPAVSKLLAALLQRTWQDPSLAEHDALIAAARAMV